jgi:hypothetical protein
VTVEGAILAGRTAAESLMVDTGVMRQPTGRTEQNPFTGEETPEYADVFTSACKVQGSSVGGSDPTYRTVTIGGVEREVVTAGLHLPHDAPSVEPGWIFEVTAVGVGSDPRLVGRRYYVHNDPAGSFKTARRLDVVEV